MYDFTEKELTAMDVMDNLQLSQSTVAGIMKRLEMKGLIERKTAKQDNRKSIIYPTSKGLQLETVLKEKAVETEAILLQGMSKKEQVEFNRLLQKALDNINIERVKIGDSVE